MESESRSWYDYLFKVGIIGDVNVGKSCLLLQLVEKTIRASYQPTRYIEYGAKVLDIGDQKIKLQIWDIGGNIFHSYQQHPQCHNCLGILLVYNIANRESFRAVQNWLSVPNIYHEFTHIMLVGNKADMGEYRSVSRLQGQALASKYKIGFCEVSTKQHALIVEVFKVLSESILKEVKQTGMIFDYKKYGVKFGSNGIFSLTEQKRNQRRRKSNCC